jgi:hypothetical protein
VLRIVLRRASRKAEQSQSCCGVAPRRERSDGALGLRGMNNARPERAPFLTRGNAAAASCLLNQTEHGPRSRLARSARPRGVALSGWERLQCEMRVVVSCVFHVPNCLPASDGIRNPRRIYASRLPGRHESFRWYRVLPPDRRGHELASIAASTRSDVNGISVSRTPTASWIALAIALATPSIPASPMPLAPNGPGPPYSKMTAS